MSSTQTPELDCSMTVNSVISRYPSTADVFNRYGIDSCCGGGTAVDVAAQSAGVDTNLLCDELRSAAVVG